MPKSHTHSEWTSNRPAANRPTDRPTVRPNEWIKRTQKFILRGGDEKKNSTNTANDNGKKLIARVVSADRAKTMAPYTNFATYGRFYSVRTCGHTYWKMNWTPIPWREAAHIFDEQYCTLVWQKFTYNNGCDQYMPKNAKNWSEKKIHLGATFRTATDRR